MNEQNKSSKTSSPTIWNVPNLLTMGRILLALVMFAVIPFKLYAVAIVLFLVAAATDWLDGWWARKFNLVSQLGRILDPLADKLIVCGAFIYLVAIPELHEVYLPECDKLNVGLAPWMVVIIVLRELLVTVLRSFVEGAGGDFSAKWVGKWKMALQCVAVPACFLYLIFKEHGDIPPALVYTLVISLWGTIILSLYSAVQYTIQAAKFGASRT